MNLTWSLLKQSYLTMTTLYCCPELLKRTISQNNPAFFLGEGSDHRLFITDIWHLFPVACRCEGFRRELQVNGLGGGSRGPQPREVFRQRVYCQEAQSQRAQEGLPLLPLQQGLPEQQQPQSAHPLTRYRV